MFLQEGGHVLEIRERIERLIAERHITKAELAKRLDIDASTLHRRLTGERKRDEEFLRGVARVLDVSVAYLLGEVQVIKSEVAEVRVYDLVSGQLVAKGVQLMPLSILTGETIMVKDGESTYLVQQDEVPAPGERGLLERGGTPWNCSMVAVSGIE